MAKEFAKALQQRWHSGDGFMESEESVITWCVGHLVTMSYPEKYDPALKKWTMEQLPFLPKDFRYETIASVKKQFGVVKSLLVREDVDAIYVCTDSGREGEYIYRLVDQMAKVPKDKVKLRVWIDSQTEEEILRGIKEAKPLREYDDLSTAAYLRAKEDYLMGINFSRVLTLHYGNTLHNFLQNKKWSAIAVGRVMTCVLGMVVKREREIRAFVKTPFYRVLASFEMGEGRFQGEWKVTEDSAYFQSPFLYKENGFKEKETAERLIRGLMGSEGASGDGSPSPPENANKTCAVVHTLEKKKEKKNPPLLFNLAELQNICSKLFKISPDETLGVVQELYEKKLVTYPRTDARVLSSAVAKEIERNLGGLVQHAEWGEYAAHILEKGRYKGLEKTRYVNDGQITDHYAIIPTGQGALTGLSARAMNVYEVITRRFLAIFYPPAVYQRVNVVMEAWEEGAATKERFFTTSKVLVEEGFLEVAAFSFAKKGETADGEAGENMDKGLVQALTRLKKGSRLPIKDMWIKEGETSPPKRYNSGSIILTMENAGQFIEDEELRTQIKGSGIGTSATRAEILKKLFNISYLSLNKKTQVITPTLQGELIYEVVDASMKPMLNPDLTASWEKGLTYVAGGQVGEEEYMRKLEDFITKRVQAVKGSGNQRSIRGQFSKIKEYYVKG